MNARFRSLEKHVVKPFTAFLEKASTQRALLNLRLNANKSSNKPLNDVARENLSSLAVLETVASQVKACRKCKLWKTRKNAVPGMGSANAKIMFVGEAPGYWEDVKGEPFVGAAGKFLDTLLAEAGVSRRQVFIGNVLKCRPPRNREPSPSEIMACISFLERQIAAIKPKLIVTLGNHSSACIFAKAGLKFNGITQARGKFYNANVLGLAVTVYPTFHPAAGLYSAKYKQLLVEDFRRLKTKISEMHLADSS
ncbi:MAG: type-4 uracil-DNA glycosylase [Candidatus Bathyarchaeia archaeon]